MWGHCGGFAKAHPSYRRSKNRRHSAFLLSNTLLLFDGSRLRNALTQQPLVPSFPLGVSEFGSTRLCVDSLHGGPGAYRCSQPPGVFPPGPLGALVAWAP